MMSMLIMMCGSSGTDEMSAAPLVSSTVVFPAAQSISSSFGVSGCSIGSPPVRQTSRTSPTIPMMLSKV